MANKRVSEITSIMAWSLGPGEDVLFSSNVDISLTESSSMDFSGVVYLIKEQDTG